VGKIFENLFKNPRSQKKKVQIYWQGDLVMAIKNVFKGKILANMTQVSDVAPGPLVFPAVKPFFYGFTNVCD
jgi:hypothetical protein